MRTLSPGPYLVRAHLTGSSRRAVRWWSAPERAQRVGHRAPSRELRRSAGGYPFSLPASLRPEAAVPPADSAGPADPPSAPPPNDDHGEVAWRLRHARRGF